MESGMEQQNVAVYRGPPCGHMPVTHPSSSRASTYSANSRESSSPCQNGGVCQPLLASFVCKCQTGYLGKRCEKRKLDLNLVTISVLNTLLTQVMTKQKQLDRSDLMGKLS